MYASLFNSQENQSRAIGCSVVQKKCCGKQNFRFVDNRSIHSFYKGLQNLTSQRAGGGKGEVIDFSTNSIGILQLKADVGLTKQAPSPAAALGGAWGLTLPENIGLDFEPKVNGGQWEMDITKINGRFSQQVRLIPGVTEVTGPKGNSNAGNYANQITDMRALGNPLGGVPLWYMLKAVQDHEDVHKSQFLPALKSTVSKIEQQFNGLTAPGGLSRVNAKNHIKGLAAFAPARTAAYQEWFNECARRIATDHKPGGHTDSAERRVVTPMINEINDAAVNNGWGPRV